MKDQTFAKSGPGDEKSIAFSIDQSSDSTNLLWMWRTIRILDSSPEVSVSGMPL